MFSGSKGIDWRTECPLLILDGNSPLHDANPNFVFVLLPPDSCFTFLPSVKEGILCGCPKTNRYLSHSAVSPFLFQLGFLLPKRKKRTGEKKEALYHVGVHELWPLAKLLHVLLEEWDRPGACREERNGGEEIGLRKNGGYEQDEGNSTDFRHVIEVELRDKNRQFIHRYTK